MNLAAVMAELAARISTISGLRVHAFPPDVVHPPSAVVTYPNETYTFDETMGRGTDRMTIPVIVLVGRVSDRKSRDQLAAYVNGSGASSIKATVEQALAPGSMDLPGAVGDYASTPDHATLDIATDIDIRWFGVADDWTPAANVALVAKWNDFAGTNQRSYLLRLDTAGRLVLFTSADGIVGLSATSTVALSPPASGFFGARATRDVDNGAAGRTTSFFISVDDGAIWTPLGAPVVQGGTTSIFNSTAVLEVGTRGVGNSDPFAGNVDRVEVRDGIDGAMVAGPDFGAQTPGTTSFVDGPGRTWTLNGTASIVPGAYTSFDSARVMDAEFDIVTIAGVDHVSATFNIDVVGQGA